MSQYQFKCVQHGTYKQEIDVNLDDIETLPQLLEAFESFLRGCGFYFDGHLDIIDDFADNSKIRNDPDE